MFLPLEIFLVIGFFSLDYLEKRKSNVKNHFNEIIKSIFSKQSLKLKRLLKISGYLLIPWLIFFIFYFSFNAYYFGDPLPSIIEGRGTSEDSLISSFFKFDSDRLDSIRTYSSEFFPESSIKFFEELSFIPRESMNEYWMSIISLSLLGLTLLISLFFKIKRVEIIVISSFIVSFLLFYSSNYIVQITEIVPRYTLPLLPFVFTIIGFLMYRCWQINYNKISLNYFKVISKSWKPFLIIVFAFFLLSSLYFSPMYNMIITQGSDFSDLQRYENRYPLDKEGLTDESIIVDARGRKVIEYGAIPFTPFRSYSDRTNSWNNNEIDQESIKLLKELLQAEEELFVFKDKTLGDPYYFRYLEAQHGIILKDYSKTFCKMIFVENIDADNEKFQSDSICYSHLTYLDNNGLLRVTIEKFIP